jgi:hypothetical protein
MAKNQFNYQKIIMEVKPSKPSHRKHQSFFVMRHGDEFTFDTPIKTARQGAMVTPQQKRPAPKTAQRPASSLNNSKLYANRHNSVEKILTRKDMFDSLDESQITIKNSLQKYIKLIRDKSSVKYERIDRELMALTQKSKGSRIKEYSNFELEKSNLQVLEPSEHS